MTAAIVVTIAIAALAAYLLYRNHKKAEAAKVPPPLEQFTSVTLPWDRLIDNSFTPAGVRVRAVRTITDYEKLVIDQGVQRTIDDTSKVWPDWQAYRDPKEFQVILIDPDTHTVEDDPGAPVLKIRYNAGTNFHPNIQTVTSAGTVVGRGLAGILGGYDNPALMIVVAIDPDTPSFAQPHYRFLRNAVRNEGEHVMENGNDANVALQFTVSADIHPHWGTDMWNDPLP